eukprot:6274611-Amphidinium_carterae.1
MQFVSSLSAMTVTASQERVASILDEVDVNRSGHLDQREFLICMRKVYLHLWVNVCQVVRTNRRAENFLQIQRNFVLHQTVPHAAYLHVSARFCWSVVTSTSLKSQQPQRRVLPSPQVSVYGNHARAGATHGDPDHKGCYQKYGPGPMPNLIAQVCELE